jgi:hypothetical protein
VLSCKGQGREQKLVSWLLCSLRHTSQQEWSCPVENGPLVGLSPWSHLVPSHCASACVVWTFSQYRVHTSSLVDSLSSTDSVVWKVSSLC